MKNIKGILTILCAAMAIGSAGCSTMAPRYSQPEAPVPAAWPNGPAYKNGAADSGGPAAADIKWQEFFANEQLQKLIAQRWRITETCGSRTE